MRVRAAEVRKGDISRVRSSAHPQKGARRAATQLQGFHYDRSVRAERRLRLERSRSFLSPRSGRRTEETYLFLWIPLLALACMTLEVQGNRMISTAVHNRAAPHSGARAAEALFEVQPLGSRGSHLRGIGHLFQVWVKQVTPDAMGMPAASTL